MGSDRREFVGALGVALASWIMGGKSSGATPPTPPPPPPPVTCYAPMPPKPPGEGDANWAKLRQCWLDLKDPRLQGAGMDGFMKELQGRHDEALKGLVTAKRLRQPVAHEIAVAYSQALAHLKRQLATCYIALPPEFTPRHDLVKQAEALASMAGQSRLDPSTVKKAEEALQRDVEWLDRWVRQQNPGKLEQIAPSPEAAEAARILVRLLLGKVGK